MLEAIEHHRKQAESSHNPDKFTSLANIGFCKELSGEYQEAYSVYQRLRGELDSLEPESEEL